MSSSDGERQDSDHGARFFQVKGVEVGMWGLGLGGKGFSSLFFLFFLGKDSSIPSAFDTGSDNIIYFLEYCRVLDEIEW